MKKISLLVYFLLISLSINAQILNRVEVKGRIIVDSNDIEGVTVYNTSSNKGTITNTKGEFAISVRLNDVIEISALQFEKITIKIDEKILNNKYFTVYLVEQVNKLNEVIITPYDMLSGNIVTDVESVKTFNPDLDAIYFGVNDIYAYEFTDDYKSEVVNTAMTPEHFRFGVDFKKILGEILKPVFKSKKNSKQKLDATEKDLTDIYGKEFLSNTFKIPEERVEEFIAYVERDQFNFHLLDKGKEVQLIEHLFLQSRLFLDDDNAED